ncbi:MAG: response regulator [Acidobacteriota bacterium]
MEAGATVGILIADDDEVYREILRDAVAGESIVSALASDGVEALEKLEADSFDILVSDLNMPRMDGLTLLKQARQRHPHLLAIIITGYGSLESAIEALRLGAYDYLLKPFKLEEMIVTARNAVEKVRMLRERSGLLAEIEALRERLRTLEGGGSLLGPGTRLLPEMVLPLHLLEMPRDNASRILSALESLKDLKRKGIIDESVFLRLRGIIIENLEPGRS